MSEHGGADERAGGHLRGDELAIDRLMRPLRLAFRWLSLAILVGMIFLPFMQIILREIIGAPLVGAEELARFTLICLVFISLPHIIYAGANIRFEELITMAPGPLLRGIRALVAAVAVGVFAIGVASATVAIMRNINTTTPTMQIPYWLFLSCVLAGFVMAAVESVVLLVKVLKRQPLYVLFWTEEPEEENLQL